MCSHVSATISSSPPIQSVTNQTDRTTHIKTSLLKKLTGNCTQNNAKVVGLSLLLLLLLKPLSWTALLVFTLVTGLPGRDLTAKVLKFCCLWQSLSRVIVYAVIFLSDG